MTSASLLDRISAILDRPDRPLDFMFLATLDAIGDLEAGAERARRWYPKSTCVLRDGRWILGTPRPIRRSEDLRGFLEEPILLDREAPLRQLLIQTPERNLLATRLHHAAGDGVSVLLWLRAQLTGEGATEPLVLRRHPRPTAGAAQGPSSRLGSRGRRNSRTRRWNTLALPTLELRESGFTYTDLLTAILLDLLEDWNRKHGVDGRVGLWIPVNIREHPFQGFGNGTSRIRVYAERGSDLATRCRGVHAQIASARERGEWAVPAETRLPDFLLRLYLNRPWVDVGTTVFTHLERFAPLPCEIEIVGQLHARYPMAFNAVTLAGTTRLTCTYDPSRADDAEVDSLLEGYRERMEAARRELSKCAVS